MKDIDINYVATRTIGYNHIDLEAAKKLGIRVGSASYEPYNVADFTVMLMLMVLRKAKISVCRSLVNDFSLDGMQGVEMRSLTVGIVGAGRIGKAVMSNLSGFGCRILVYDPYVIPSTLPAHVKAVSFDELLKESDIVSLHVPLTKANYHMFDTATFAKMKRGAILINTARGALVDTEAFLQAIESGHLAGAGLDTAEHEDNYFHVDHRAHVLSERTLFYLKQFPNIIYTPHYAFFTEEATASMVKCALECLSDFHDGMNSEYEIKI